MAQVPAPNLVEAALIYAIGDQSVENTYALRCSAPATRTDLQAIAGALQTAYIAQRANFSLHISLTKIYCRALDSSSAPTWEQAAITPTDGTATGAPFPNNVTFALKRYTGLAGRANRGRVYHPCISEDWITSNNTISPTWAINLEGAHDAIHTSPIGAGHVVAACIWHRKLGTSTDILGYTYTDLVFDSQRRRLPAHGIHH